VKTLVFAVKSVVFAVKTTDFAVKTVVLTAKAARHRHFPCVFSTLPSSNPMRRFAKETRRTQACAGARARTTAHAGT
jgi:hypothetical protein